MSKGLEYLCRSRVVWPDRTSRTPGRERIAGQFKTQGRAVTMPQAEARVAEQLDLFTKRGQDWRTMAVEMAADWEVGRQGNFLLSPPRQGVRDPGVVVSFALDGRPITLPSDAYLTPAANLAAVAAHIESLRTIARHRIATVEMLLGANAALPRQAGDGALGWWQVLTVSPAATEGEVEAAYRRLARIHHPDVPGGSEAAMSAINRARDEWRAQRG